MDAAEAVEVPDAYPAGYDQQRGDGLHDELGAVAHAHQVVGHAGEVEDYGGAAGEAQRRHAAVQQGGHRVVVGHDPHAEQQQQGEQDGGEEGYAPQPRHLGLVDLARVRRVEQVLAERYKQYLRDDEAGDQDHQRQYRQVDVEPLDHMQVVLRGRAGRRVNGKQNIQHSYKGTSGPHGTRVPDS